METFDVIAFVIAVLITIFASRIAFKKQKRRSLDGFIVKQLEDGGINVQQQQMLEFWFYSNNEVGIKVIEDELKQQGFDVFVNETEEDPRYVIRALKKLVPDIVILQKLRADFSQLTKNNGARYDGWGCSANEKIPSEI